MTAAILAYTPFIEPLNLALEWWYLLLIPLSFGISVIYKALRVVDFESYWRQVIALTLQIVIAMVGLALALVFLVLWVIPRLPVP